MAKFKPIPNNLMDLRERLEKLKDRELRLETALAIYDRPELEKAILQIMMALDDVKKADLLLRITQRPERINEDKLVSAQGQLDMYEGKLEKLQQDSEGLEDESKLEQINKMVDFYSKKIRFQEGLIEDLAEGFDDNLLTIKAKKIKAIERLDGIIESHSSLIKQSRVNIVELIPEIGTHLKVKV